MLARHLRIQEVFCKQGRMYVRNSGVSRLRLPKKAFRDAVHGFVEIPRTTLLRLVDTPEFQRLRRLTQLGTSSFTYPGGEHSRFQHSLGVAHLFLSLAAHFSEQGTPLTEEEHLVGSCAALLHDVGHGPFSHALEGVLVPHKHHEKWTQEIILSQETQVNRRLAEIDPSLPEKVANVIGKHPANSILVSMISSQLDVDRMDYLLRDSRCVGVPYGAFDVDRLIRMLFRQDDKIVVDHRGLMNAQEYLFARYHMYWQVYFHLTTRGYERVLKAAWSRAKKLQSDNRLDLTNLTPAVRSAIYNSNQSELSLQDYLALDNHDIYTALKVWRSSKDDVLADLCRRLLDRDILKPVVVKGDTLWGSENAVNEIVKEKGFDPEFYVLFDRSSDVAYDYYAADEGDGTKPSILVQNREGNTVEISRESDAIAAIARNRAVRVAIYVPQECREEVTKVLQR